MKDELRIDGVEYIKKELVRDDDEEDEEVEEVREDVKNFLDDNEEDVLNVVVSRDFYDDYITIKIYTESGLTSETLERLREEYELCYFEIRYYEDRKYVFKKGVQ